MRDNLSAPLLTVKDLRVSFAGAQISAVNGLSFDVNAGETLALVGESGCGKSTTALAIMRLLARGTKIEGELLFGGENLVSASEKAMRHLRGNRIGMIFQEPMTALNPVHTIGSQLIEVLRAHRKLSQREARARALELFNLVQIPNAEERIDHYPHQFSGGQRQRVMIAMAIACEPELLIADEPTTALDATIQAQILELLDNLCRQMNMGLLLITHDLALVNRWADRVLVMHHGEKMEQLPAKDLFATARHPYTKGLIGASIGLDESFHYRKKALSEIRSTRDAFGQYRFQVIEPPLAQQYPLGKAAPLLEVRDLSVCYAGPLAVDRVSLSLKAGETLGIVGESGSGKSTLSKAILRLIPSVSGQILLKGKDITHQTGADLRATRSQIQMIFQDPFASLNPRHSIETILEGPLRLQNPDLKPAERQRSIAQMLDKVGLASNALSRYPHEFSGGQRQRIGIARALILRPSLVVCDEPVSALDVSVQAQILNLLAELKAELGLSYLFISHDLAVIQYISDRVMVMQNARKVEEADHNTIWINPQMEYTRRLIAAVRREKSPEALEGPS